MLNTFGFLAMSFLVMLTLSYVDKLIPYLQDRAEQYVINNNPELAHLQAKAQQIREAQVFP